MSKYRKRGYKKNTKRNVGAELEGMLFALETLLGITNGVLDETRNENLYLTARNKRLSDMLKELNICVCRQGEQIERQKEEIVRLKRKSQKCRRQVSLRKQTRKLRTAIMINSILLTMMMSKT